MQNSNQTQLKMSILASPNMTNFSGVVHGGELLKLLDQVAYVCSTRYCGVGCVTAGVDQVFFRAPIPIGSLIHFYASINYTSKTSCEVGIRVESEDPKTQKTIHANTAYFTMVALDDNRQKVQIPPLIPQNQTQKRRYQEAQKRKENKLA